MTRHKNTWENKEYMLSVNDWVALTGFTHETLAYRIRQFDKHKMTREEVMFKGALNSNRGRPRYISKADIVLDSHLSIFLYSSERPVTTGLKRNKRRGEFEQWVRL